MAETLNLLLDRIGTLMDSLRQVSSDIDHDLRTPLIRLFQKLEYARAHARSTVEYIAASDGDKREVKDILETFSALLSRP